MFVDIYVLCMYCSSIVGLWIDVETYGVIVAANPFVVVTYMYMYVGSNR